MPQSDRSWAQIRALARELLHRADAGEPGLVERLRSDVEGTIRARRDLVVVDRRPGTIVTGCRIGGAYVRRNPPALPRIVLSRTGEPRRDRFNLGHEFCHHLIDHDATLANLLFAQQDRGHALEEDICDSATAYCLVRGEDVDQALADHAGVTARAVRVLHARSQGSLEVCCIALANRMAVPGHVLVCDPDPADRQCAQVRFVARGPDAERIPASGPQRSPLFDTALEAGEAAGTIQLRAGDGSHALRHVDVASVDGALVCVLAPHGHTSVGCC